MLANYRAAAEDKRRCEGEAREEASRAFHRATHPVVTRRSSGCGTGDLRDNGGSNDDSPSSSSSYKDDDAYAGAALGEERGAIRTN